MEEVIGEIKDEFDDDIEVEYKKIDEYNFVFEGKTLLNDFCRVLDLETTTFDRDKGEADTLAGLVLEHAGEIPQLGSKYSINEYDFEVIAVSNRRIRKIKTTLPKSN